MTIEAQAQSLGREQAARADLVLLCLGPTSRTRPEDVEMLRQEKPPVVGVATKCDLSNAAGRAASGERRHGEGLAALREALAERARCATPAGAGAEPEPLPRPRRGVPGLLRRAHAVVLFEEPAELLALELRGRWSSWARWSGRSTPTICWTAFSAGFASGNETAAASDAATPRRRDTAPSGGVATIPGDFGSRLVKKGESYTRAGKGILRWRLPSPQRTRRKP